MDSNATAASPALIARPEGDRRREADAAGAPPVASGAIVAEEAPDAATNALPLLAEQRRSSLASLSIASATEIDEDPAAAKFRRKAEDAKLPFGFLIASILFPPMGCIAFFMALKFPADSPRYVWAVRAMYVGAGLSFAYIVFIACMLGSARYVVE